MLPDKLKNIIFLIIIAKTQFSTLWHLGSSEGEMFCKPTPLKARFPYKAETDCSPELPAFSHADSSMDSFLAVFVFCRPQGQLILCI
jgi:hypothetical protein